MISVHYFPLNLYYFPVVRTLPDYKKIYDNRLKLRNSISVTSIITMLYYDFTANYHSREEKHPFWELVYVDNGRVIVTADGSTHIISKGEIIFHKPNELHSIKCDGETPANIFIVTFVAGGKAMNTFKSQVVKVPYNLQGILTCFVDEMQSSYGECPGLITEHIAGPFGAEQMLKGYLEQFLILLKRYMDNGTAENSRDKLLQHNGTADNLLVTNVIDMLESNIYGNITLEDICRQTNYKKSRLCEIFKKVTGKTIIQYYTDLKINEAKSLMQRQKLNNTQISDRLMFSSPQYFTRIFKATTSMTPSEYRRSIKYK